MPLPRPLAPPVAPPPSSSPFNQPPANPARVAALSAAPPPPRPSSIASSHSNPDDSDSEEEEDSPPLNASKPASAPSTPQARPAPPKAPGPVTAQTQAQPVARRAVRDRFPALNLISALLRGISANDPRRGAQVFAQVLESAHGVYDAVAAGVEELKSGKARDAPARRALFDGWTTAAGVLEESVLLNICVADDRCSPCARRCSFVQIFAVLAQDVLYSVERRRADPTSGYEHGRSS